MKFRKAVIFMAITIVLSLIPENSVAGSQELFLPSDEPTPLKSFSTKSILSINNPDRGLYIDGITKKIADDPSEDERTAAIAQCGSDNYLVVYVRNSEIYGQRLSSTGFPTNDPFLISTSGTTKSSPDIACDWSREIYVVVWNDTWNETEFDIHTQAVYGSHQESGSQLFGNGMEVIGTPDSERNPKIACNSEAHSCLVVYEYDGTGAGDIYGSRIRLGSTGLIDETWEFFNISNYYKPERSPNLTWAGQEDEYLVVWEFEHDNPAKHYRIGHATVHDEPQSGSQVKGVIMSLLDYNLNYQNQTYPTTAYNPRTRQYLIVFQYRYMGTTELVMAQRIGNDRYHVGDMFPIDANWEIDQGMPAVTYSNVIGSVDEDLGLDQFLVTYILGETTETIIAQAVKGDHATRASQLIGEPLELFQSQDFGSSLGYIDLAYSSLYHKYMVVWELMLKGYVENNYDILGQMVKPNEPPYFLSSPILTCVADENYFYDIVTYDPNYYLDASLTITAPTLPAWLTLESYGNGGGKLTGKPSQAEIGDHSVTLKVTDKFNESATQSFTISVMQEQHEDPPVNSVYIPLISK